MCVGTPGRDTGQAVCGGYVSSCAVGVVEFPRPRPGVAAPQPPRCSSMTAVLSAALTAAGQRSDRAVTADRWLLIDFVTTLTADR